jgi:vacuolar-type H+-ATPase subunit F/Vma7
MGHTRRVQINIKERNYRDAMNTCIDEASRKGFAHTQPEPGLVYYAAYDQLPEDAFDELRRRPVGLLVLNEDKSAGIGRPMNPSRYRSATPTICSISSKAA